MHLAVTINLIFEIIVFLYGAKYFEYNGNKLPACFTQLLFLSRKHYLIECVLICFGCEEGEYLNKSLPEIKNLKLKSLILSKQRQDESKKPDDVKGAKKKA